MNKLYVGYACIFTVIVALRVAGAPLLRCWVGGVAAAALWMVWLGTHFNKLVEIAFVLGWGILMVPFWFAGAMLATGVAAVIVRIVAKARALSGDDDSHQ